MAAEMIFEHLETIIERLYQQVCTRASDKNTW